MHGDTRNLLHNPVQLVWAAAGGHEIDLARGMDWFVNVLAVDEGSAVPDPQALGPIDDQLSTLLHSHGGSANQRPTFRLVVIADESDPVEFDCTYEMPTGWNSLEWKR